MKKKIFKIAFFSGTGGTEYAAELLADNLWDRGHEVIMERIAAGSTYHSERIDHLILMYPVHAADAPEMVYQYIKNMPKLVSLETSAAKPVRASVISVSGGGEVLINRAARLGVIKKLYKKGYWVPYENSLILPSNFLVMTPRAVAIELLRVLPYKVEKIATDLLKRVRKRVKPPMIDQIISNIGKVEKVGAKIWGSRITCNVYCTSCGWCERHCPTGNIVMKKGYPHFLNHCNLCTKCVYGCPSKALEPAFLKPALLKSGYPLEDLIELSKTATPFTEQQIIKLKNGKAWTGIGTYLSEQ